MKNKLFLIVLFAVLLLDSRAQSIINSVAPLTTAGNFFTTSINSGNTINTNGWGSNLLIQGSGGSGGAITFRNESYSTRAVHFIGGPSANPVGDFWHGIQTGTPGSTVANTYAYHICGTDNNNAIGMTLGDVRFINSVFVNTRLAVNTTNPTATLHNSGSVRFQNLTTGTPTTLLGTDVSGNVYSADGLRLNQSFTDYGTFYRYGVNTSASGSKITSISAGPTGNGRMAAAEFLATSDERFKKDIKILENVTSKIMRLRGVSYTWKVEEYKDR